MELRLSGAVLDANGLNDWWRETLPEVEVIDEPAPDDKDTGDDTDPEPDSH